jgi:hypothetical protein
VAFLQKKPKSQDIEVFCLKHCLFHSCFLNMLPMSPNAPYGQA